MKANIYLGNALEKLIHLLKEQLFFSSSAPFSRKMVILPNAFMKNYLMQALCRDPSLNVVAGVEFVTLQQALSGVAPSRIELALRIEKELQASSSDWPDYLRVEGDLLEHRIRQLATELSRLFVQYGIYGKETLNEWLEQGGWQQRIWKAIFSAPIRALAAPRTGAFSLHLFGFSFLPKLYFDFFQGLNSVFYILSPCAHFWGDLYSDHILAKLGKAAGHFAKLFEESSFVEEDYSERGGSYLENIQRSMLYLEEIAAPYDETVELHAAGSKLEEVQLLFDRIALLLEAHEPKEILVLAPDIEEYLPFIHFVFADKIPYALFDITSEGTDGFFQGLLHLIELPALRFEKQAVLKLLDFPAFLKKRGLSDQEVSLIKHWVDEAQIEWGIDSDNRQSYLEDPLLEKNEQRTWLGGLDRLLSGLVEVRSDGLVVDFSDAELLGKWALIICSLKEELLPAFKGKKTCAEWTQVVRNLAERYFLVSEESERVFRELAHLFSPQIGSGVFAMPSDKRDREIENYHFSFESFKPALIHACSKRTHFQGNQLQAVRFTAMAHGSAIPSEVVCLLGMQEEAFPRKQRLSSLASLRLPGFLSQADLDRASFLETLLSARKRLYISYLCVDERDGKEMAPSPVVLELPGIVNLCKKPRAPSPIKKLPPPFFPEWYQRTPLKEPLPQQEISIDLKHLKLLARDPIQFYFNRVLHIYLDHQEKEDREFAFSHLNRAILRKELVARPTDQLTEEHLLRLPEGAFKKLARRRMMEEVEELNKQFKEVGVSAQELFSIELERDRREASQGALPALRIALSDTKTALIYGKLSDLSPAGMVFYGGEKLEELAKIWPLYLVYLHLDAKGQLLLLKKGKKIEPPTHPQEALLAYLRYYEVASENPSPLMPEWLPFLVKADLKGLKKAIDSSFHENFFPNRYLDWLRMRGSLPEASILLERWHPIAKELYATI